MSEKERLAKVWELLNREIVDTLMEQTSYMIKMPKKINDCGDINQWNDAFDKCVETDIKFSELNGKYRALVDFQRKVIKYFKEES